MTSKAQQIELDNALVAPENHRVIGKCNMRINLGMKPKEPTYQVVLDALALTTCYHAFLITAEVLVIYMHQEILNICPKFLGKAFDEPPTEEEALSFIRELDHIREIRHANTQVYGAILPQAMTNQALLDSVAYKTYYAIASGAEPPKSRKRVPDEQHHKTSCTDEGTSTKLRVLDVPKYESDSEQESWGDSDEEDDDDEDDSGDESDDGDNDDDDCDKYVGDNNDGKDDDEADSERTESDREEIPDLNQSNEEREQQEEDVDKRVHTPDDYELTDEENIDDEDKMDEEENDDITKELYKDVNVNLGNEDAEMIHDDQGGADEHNDSQELGFVQEEEDAHVTLTTVHDSQKTEGLMQSSSVSSDFTSKLLNLENISPADNEIASLMDTTIHHEEPSNGYIDNKLGEAMKKAIQSHNTECREEAQAEKHEYIDLIDTNRDEKDKDQDPSAGSDRGTKRRKLSKEAELSKDSSSKEKNHTVDDSEVQQNQEFDMGHTDDQPNIEAALKRNWFKKPERPPTLDLDWNKRQQVNFRPPQTWISQVARAEDPPTSFDELYNTPIDLSAFVLNQLNITDLT
ncbi:hypothetical protein Tco_1253488 [Tanacetum coccineum]